MQPSTQVKVSKPTSGARPDVLGAIAGAKHVHTLAKEYGVPVILHTDHAAKKLLPWIDGLLEAGEKHFAETGRPLFSSHMLDLSEEPMEENMAICREYLARMDKLGMTLEIEIGRLPCFLPLVLQINQACEKRIMDDQFLQSVFHPLQVSHRSMEVIFFAAWSV